MMSSQYQRGSSACKMKMPIQSQLPHQHQHGSGCRKTKTPTRAWCGAEECNCFTGAKIVLHETFCKLVDVSTRTCADSNILSSSTRTNRRRNIAAGRRNTEGIFLLKAGRRTAGTVKTFLANHPKHTFFPAEWEHAIHKEIIERRMRWADMAEKLFQFEMFAAQREPMYQQPQHPTSQPTPSVEHSWRSVLWKNAVDRACENDFGILLSFGWHTPGFKGHFGQLITGHAPCIAV